MPYRSRKQQRYMHAAAERGEISQKTVQEFDRATDFSNLPESAPKRKKNPRKKRS